MRVARVLETCLYVDDLEVAKAFYDEVLGLEPFAQVEGRHVFFRCREAVVLLFNPEQSGRPSGSVPPHGARGPGHIAFAVEDASLSSWREHLRRHGVTIEAEVDWPGGGRSIYFRDPAGNSVELTTPETWGLEK